MLSAWVLLSSSLDFAYLCGVILKQFLPSQLHVGLPVALSKFLGLYLIGLFWVTWQFSVSRK